MYSLCFADKNLSQPSCIPYLGRLNFADAEKKRAELLKYFYHTWELNESLFECLVERDESAWYTKSIPVRHPLIFYYGHNAAFYMNKFLAAKLISPSERIDEEIEASLAVGVDEMSWDSKPGEQVYPSVTRIREYRHRVKKLVVEVLTRVSIDLPISWESPLWAILMGMEHERIHMETSSVLIRQLSIQYVRSRPQWPICPLARHDRSKVPPNRFIPISGTRVTLGKTDDTFGWDNEYGREVRDVYEFEVSQFLVSNTEYLPFVLDDGYAEKRWWDEEGWCWREHSGAVQPTFWVGRATVTNLNELKLRVMTEEIPMPWDWPVEVNQLEAAAFCRWKSTKINRQVRLPSESEWYRLREMVHGGDQPDWKTTELIPGNINLAWWASSCPIDIFKQTEDCYDVIGNVWQWTNTPIYPFEGFRVHPLYDDYSVPTFDGKHTLIKGGCWISTGHVALKAYRDCFRRHFFQHAGFRYVTSTAAVVIGREIDLSPSIAISHNTDETVSKYLEFQYGPEYFGVPNYARTLIELAVKHCDERKRDIALDVGSSTGRTTFELARYFDLVIGMDSTTRFIDVALRLLRGEKVEYTTVVEGDLLENRCANFPSDIRNCEISKRVHFVQGDACNMKPEYRQERKYDFVLASDVLDRVREPRLFLQNITPTIRSGGVLVLSSTWTWHETCTSREEWLSGSSKCSHETLRELLQNNYDEIAASPVDVPFIFRETARKFQHYVAQVSLWRKR